MTPEKIRAAYELIGKREKLESALRQLEFPCSLRLETFARIGGQIAFMLEDFEVSLERLFQDTLQARLDAVNAELTEIGVEDA